MRFLVFFLLISLNFSAFSLSFKPVDDSSESKTPERIISLGPYITEELYLLGGEDKLIGCTVYCNRPDDARNKPKVATAVMPNVEIIVGLKPDLILSTSLIDKKAVRKLEKLGLGFTLK